MALTGSDKIKFKNIFIIFILMIFIIPIISYAKIPFKESSESKEIWEELEQWFPNEKIRAGVMGLFWKESNFKSNALAGYMYHEKNICEKFCKEINDNLVEKETKEKFIRMVRYKYGGFGLSQWSTEKYLSDFYDFIIEKNGIIEDTSLQCEFTYVTINQNKKLMEALEIYQDDEIMCGRIIGYLYDGATPEHCEAIASAAQFYYEKYSTEGKDN